MGDVDVFGAAVAAVAAARAAVAGLLGPSWSQVNAPDLLTLAGQVEQLSRLTGAVQIGLAGELDTRGVAAAHGSASTGALLRNTLLISQGEARARVAAAAVLLPRTSPSGATAGPVLPLLAAAVTAGTIGVEQARVVVATMNKLPAAVDPQTRELCQRLLVDNAVLTEPVPFAVFARMVAASCDPDGDLDPTPPSEKVELTLGTRNPGTGLTRLTGLLDDLGVETLSQAISGLARPIPGIDGGPDPRSAATRRAHGLLEALRRYLDNALAPVSGSEQPHITVTIDLEALRTGTGTGSLEHGGPISAAQARVLACDAKIIPAVLGSPSQVLDIGTATRVFPAAIRRAITLRDKGCTWPGCDRPPAWTDAHHVRHWATGTAPTAYDNAVLLCRHHHTQIHYGHWAIHFHPDGTPEYTPPPWIDPHQTPRRNTHHHATRQLRT